MNISDELERLRHMRDSGSISEEEYERAKSALPNPPVRLPDEGASAQQSRQWAMFLHFSLLAGFAVPLAGLVAPIIIWQVKKAEYPELDVHGKIAVNWILSMVVYAIASALLILVLVGIPLLIALGVLTVVFPIVGGIKANNGEVWSYPLSIQFLK
jgi:uncharacterized Tic20 family protein